jgi:hypothetical protein
MGLTQANDSSWPPSFSRKMCQPCAEAESLWSPQVAFPPLVSMTVLVIVVHRFWLWRPSVTSLQASIITCVADEQCILGNRQQCQQDLSNTASFPQPVSRGRRSYLCSTKRHTREGVKAQTASSTSRSKLVPRRHVQIQEVFRHLNFTRANACEASHVPAFRGLRSQCAAAS